MPMPDNHKCQVQITKGVDKKRKGGKVALETLVAVKKRMAFDGHSPIASTQSRVKRSQIESRANSIMRTWQNTIEHGLSHHVTVVTVLQGHESLASAKTTGHPGH